MASDSVLPDWLEQGVESVLRDSDDDAQPVPVSVQSLQLPVPRSIASSNRASPIVLTPSGPSPSGSYVRQDSKNSWKDLDKFYEDTNEDEEEEEEETETEEETEEESVEEEEHAKHHEGPENSEEEEEVSGEEGSSEEEDEHDHSHHAGHAS